MQDLRVLFLVALCLCLGWSIFYEFLPVIWISDYGFNAEKVGLFFAYGSIIYALSSGLLIRPVVEHLKAASVLFYSLCALGIVVFLLLFFTSASWIWIYLPIVNILIAFIYPTYTTMISDAAGKDAQGEILGVSGSIQSLAFALSPLLGGALIGAGEHLPMMIGGIAVIFAGICSGITFRKQIFKA